MKFINKQNLLAIGLLIVLSIPSILPLIQPGFFVTDDGEWAIIRLSAFYAALGDGQFPVRFLERLNFGYGYPVSTFLYPGIMYLGALIHVFKVGFVDSIKVVLALSMIGSGIFTYLWLRRFFDKISSLVGALFYLYTPYHLYDLYTRGSIGEIAALGVIPFILWQLERKSILWTASGIGLLILSHNTLAAVFLIFIFGYMLLDFYVSKNKTYLFYSLTLLLGIGLSAFFWLPVIFELRYTVFSSTTVSDWSKYFASLQLIGYSTVAVLFLTIANFISKKASIKKHRLTAALLVVCIISIFLASSISYPLWRIFPVEFVQFPFRSLSVTIICISFLAAFSISTFKSRNRIIMGFILVVILIFSASEYLRTPERIDKGDAYYATNEATTTIKDEYMPVWVKEKPFKRSDKKVEVIKGQGNIENILYDNKKITFNVNLENNSRIQINTIYWPGWIAYVDEKASNINYNNPKGLMTLDLPQGNHYVRVEFGETPQRLAADIITFVSFIIVVILSIHSMKKNNMKNKQK